MCSIEAKRGRSAAMPFSLLSLCVALLGECGTPGSAGPEGQELSLLQVASSPEPEPRPSAAVASAAVIDGAFELQPYELPHGQGYRHMTATGNAAQDEMILFGGLGDGPPRPPTPMNPDVFTLDLTKPASERKWQNRSRDDVVPFPWFTSTRGFIRFGDKYYLACDDSNENAVFSFDPTTYRFELLSNSTLGPQIDAGDCCAVGVTVASEQSPPGCGEEERVYILGGRIQSEGGGGPVSRKVRYYSITHSSWHVAADMHVGRSHLGCSAVQRNGKSLVYAIGGGDAATGEALRSIEIYDVTVDRWALYPDYFLPGGGRTRLAVQNVDDDYLLLIGGDRCCVGGLCCSNEPLTTVEVIDMTCSDRLISSTEEHPIPQLLAPRQTPATLLRTVPGMTRCYELYVVGGRSRNESGTLVLTTTEFLKFTRINTGACC